MRKDDLTRLRHMIEFAQGALRFAEHRTREDLDRDQMLTLALIKAIETVGEAAYKLSPELRERHPELFPGQVLWACGTSSFTHISTSIWTWSGIRL
jgi:uncharacterized protein with HEPN domain